MSRGVPTSSSDRAGYCPASQDSHRRQNCSLGVPSFPADVLFSEKSAAESQQTSPRNFRRRPNRRRRRPKISDETPSGAAVPRRPQGVPKIFRATLETLTMTPEDFRRDTEGRRCPPAPSGRPKIFLGDTRNAHDNAQKFPTTLLSLPVPFFSFWTLIFCRPPTTQSPSDATFPLTHSPTALIPPLSPQGNRPNSPEDALSAAGDTRAADTNGV
jgi:hypothetical protein